MHPLRDKTAIAGVGATRQGKLPDAVKVGSALEVVFDAVTPEIAIPRFRLVTDVD